MTGSQASGRGVALSLTGRVLWRVAAPVLRLIGRLAFAMRVEWQAPLPPDPFVLAANHYSHFDPPVIGAATGHPVRYLALEDLFGASRFFDWLINGFGAIPTPRHRTPVAATRTALALLEMGESVGVFPEASRVTHWGTLPSKRGAAWLAVHTGAPLVPVAVIGTGRVFGLENRLRRGRIRVIVGEPLTSHGRSPEELTRLWEDWIGEQIRRFPGSEVEGERRSYLLG